jgi:DNA-binding NarL/FixJ family response regulator
MSKRYIIVVEDEPFLCSLISDALLNAGFDVSTAGSASEARRLFNKRDPDAAILDIDLGPGPTGLDLGEALLSRSPGTAVVYLTMLSDPRVINPNGLKNPRAAYLNKRKLSNTNELIDALEAVLHDKDLTEYRHDLDPTSPIASLSAGQLQVLQAVAKGLTNQQIATLRKRSLSATEALISRTFAALGLDAAGHANARILAVREYIAHSGIVVRDDN